MYKRYFLTGEKEIKVSRTSAHEMFVVDRRIQVYSMERGQEVEPSTYKVLRTAVILSEDEL